MNRPVRRSPGLPLLVVLGAIGACVALVFLQWARGLLIPLTVGLVLAFTLNPLVRRLRRWGVPRMLGAALAVLAAWAVGALLAVSLQGDIVAVAGEVPAAVQRMARGVDQFRSHTVGVVASLRNAAAALEHLLDGAPAAGADGNTVRVRVDAPAFRLSDFLWTGSISLLTFVGELSVISFLVFFLLCSGEAFKRKLVGLAGSDWHRRRVTLRLIHRVGTQIQYSLLVLAGTNLVVGLATGAAFALIGLRNIPVWIAFTTALHFVPYFGAGVLAVSATAVAWLQFESWPLALLTGGVSLALATLIGTFLTTGLQSRVSRLDPAAVFVGLLIWGWLWGIWGFLLGMPLLAIVKVVCDHVDALAPFGRFLEAARRPASARRRWPAGRPGPGFAKQSPDGG